MLVVNDPKGFNVYYCKNLKRQYKSTLRAHFIGRAVGSIRSRTVLLVDFHIDCKTVRIFAYSSTREQSNERSGTRLKTESKTEERR